MANGPGRFEDANVVVTGSSRGIGAAIAAAFAREGARVFGVARSDQSDTARRAGSNFTAIPFDFSGASADALRSLTDQLWTRAGRIDVLVNNAGIIRRAPALEFSEADWDEVLRINLSSPFFLTQAIARKWLASRRPECVRLRIINVASLLSFQGGITVPSYAASKHGIAGLTKALANEWARLGINVNAVAPGYVRTENTRALQEDPVRDEAIRARIPQGDWGRPQDIAGACLFLASPDADYVNGAVLNVDGGWMGR